METISEKIKIDKSNQIKYLQAEIKHLQDDIKVLKKKKNLKDHALNVSQNSTVITDFRGKIIWVNKAFTRLTGYSLEEVIGKNPRILKSGKHDEEFYNKLWDTIISGKSWHGEIINKKKSGELYHERINIEPVLNDENIITNFIATKEDITGKRLTDEALNESYIKYEELAYIFNQSPAIGFLWSENEERSVEFVTENIKQWNYTPEEFYSQKLSFSDIIYSEDKKNVLDEISEKINAGKERLKQHYRIITKNGDIRWVDSHLYVRLGENDSVTHLQGVVLDVTDRKMAEEESKHQLEQLMQADKMIALGTLVSGVAHEINNPNNFVMLNIPLIEKVWFNILPILQNHFEENGDFSVGDRLMYSKIKQSMPLLLGGINDGSQRIKNIVEDLKSFARKDSLGYNQEVDINKVVQTSVNLTANLVSKSTEKFVVKYSPKPLYVKGNKQKLEQVLINLIENSCQALSERKQSVKILIEQKSNFAIINVSDEGYGIKSDVIKKIKDPFFTTKRNKGGTGLGLSIASKILIEHNGTLDFQSEPEKGTTATIKIPILNGESK
ncbi:MAG: PAS domain S-box protein [Ignavibacteriae bacterium]|nr:PAS domain S-box protein [Ignavibacteriota bacterium]MCB9207826.1 PAS domain S-box protein [Ignavibacteriales bacterium]MCB9258595.1 PAS domain S-box protein [Ignavibacteriales bacterium]